MRQLSYDKYENYRLRRIVSIYTIVSADYLYKDFFSKKVHTHENAWELCYCLTGEIQISYNDTTKTLRAQQCIAIPPGTYHNTHIMHAGSEAIIISFTCMDDYLPMLCDRILDADTQQHRLFQQILTELRYAFIQGEKGLRMKHFDPNAQSPLGAEQLICCYLEEILIGLFRQTVGPREDVHAYADHKAVQRYLVQQINEYIQNHIGQSLRIEELADHFHYSRNQIGSLYKAATGTPLGRAIVLERIAKAKEMLLAGEKSITEIAYELGYSSPQYFSKNFSRETGYPPSRYIAKRKSKADS